MRRRALLVGALTFAFVPFVGVSSAHACSCIEEDEKASYERAEVVFRGTVLEQPGPGVVSFEATRVYKGAVTSTLLVETGGENGSCGWDLPGPGPFLVFGTTAGGTTLEANLCSGTRAIDASETPSFGDGAPVALTGGPTDARRPSPWSTALPVAAIAGGAGLLAVALLRRRRQPPAG